MILVIHKGKKKAVKYLTAGMQWLVTAHQSVALNVPLAESNVKGPGFQRK